MDAVKTQQIVNSVSVHRLDSIAYFAQRTGESHILYWCKYISLIITVNGVPNIYNLLSTELIKSISVEVRIRPLSSLCLINQINLCKIWGSHGGEYEECRLVGYKTSVRTSEGTHYISATQSCRLMLHKIWGFHGADYEECCLLWCYAVWCVADFNIRN
jgi:hypothetical protein